MKRTRFFAALIAALVPAAFVPACSGPTGELVLVVQSDMELPKDVDTITIEVTSGGIPFLAQTYENLGGTGGIKLPATLGIATPDETSRPVTIRIIARSNGREGKVRVLREATTTVPGDRIATFHMPFSFLCDGRAIEEKAGVVTSDCDQGMTCVAGDCVPIVVDAPPTTPFEEDDVFGGGTGKGDGVCFDVTGCMEGGAITTPALKKNPDAMEGDICALEVDASAGDVNVALLTETTGMCNADGCFVPLDAQSLAGWMRSVADPGTLVLPGEVCRQLGEKVRGVVTAPLKPGCPLKEVRTPTCGPWSAVGKAASPIETKPIAHASGQHNPSSLALSGEDVLWTSRGLFDSTPAQRSEGAVKAAPQKPGEVREINATMSMSARDIVVRDGFAYWTIASALGGAGEIWRTQLVATDPPGPPTGPISGMDGLDSNAENPEGIAANDSRVFWTEFTSGAIKSIDLMSNKVNVIATGVPSNHPYRIVADKSMVCWTNEGSVTMPDGTVECTNADGSNPVANLVATGQATPRAIALDEGASGEATDNVLYWATFTEGGALWKAANPNSGLATPVMVAGGLSFPNGIAVDADNIYVTTWGDGSVHRIAKTDGASPEVIASGQRKPAEIAIGATHIFWVNEGSVLGNTETTGEVLVGDGAIMRLLKAQ